MTPLFRPVSSLSSFIASLDATFTHFSPCSHSEQQWVQDFACWFFLILKICSSNPRAFQNAHCRSPVSQRLTFSCSVSSSEWICLKFIPRGWLWQSLTLPGTLAWLLGIHKAGAQSHKLTVEMQSGESWGERSVTEPVWAPREGD